MPIKFRCKHCRQFLGISRSKAGSVVDCPTCGRALRVPTLKGQVAPIPEPKLNLQDSGLTKALDELAMIGEFAPDELDDIEQPPIDSDDANSAAPAPLPEPVPIEPPLPAEPVSPRPQQPPSTGPAVSSAGSVSEFGADPSARAEQSVTSSAAAAGHSADDPLAALVAQGRRDSTTGSSPIAASKSGFRPYFTTPVVVTLCGVACVAFALGYLTGRSGSSEERNQTSVPQANGPDSGKAVNSNGEVAQPAAPTPALRGRITYKAESGESRPDQGARVIVFPQKRQGTAKSTVVGFRPADAASDMQAAAAWLRAIGGDVAVVDDQGNFEIAVGQAGTVHILVLSHNLSRDDDEPTEPELKNLLDSYFDRPTQLLGRIRFHFSQVRYKGEGTERWDYSFERM